MKSTEALALRALSTPAVEATDAMEVLVDVLLEARILSGDELGEVGDEPAVALRRKAFEWARRRLCRAPNPMEELVGLVIGELEHTDLPYAIVGVVGPFLLRIHFLENVDPYLLAAAATAVRARLPAGIIVETTCRT
ncbi:MAG: hypothetical protein K0S65_1046 [Labilithrix sp.]|nr:hypothetical protein [Labilithrix sp.]